MSDQAIQKAQLGNITIVVGSHEAALITYTTRELRGTTITIQSKGGLKQQKPVLEWMTGREKVCAAAFTNVQPGQYIMSWGNQTGQITIDAGKINQVGIGVSISIPIQTVIADYATVEEVEKISSVTTLGTDKATGDEVSVEDEYRESGMYVCGVQGTGKSSFLESLLYQDIMKGQAVILIDPHGDLIEHVLAQLPEERVKDTYLLDLEDIKHPFGINLFSTHPQAGHLPISKASERIVHVFERLFPTSARMLLEEYLENIALVFLENPGHTMLDIPRFLTDEVFRASLIKNLKNTYLRDYWQKYNTLSLAKQQEETAPLRRRLNGFLNKPLVTHIVGQKHSTLDFRSAIQHREIILIRLPIKTLGEIASLIGTMLIALIYSVTFSFGNKPRSQRPGFSFYVDEFQNFSTLDFAELFTEGRKFRTRQVLANQFTKQLDLEQMQEAVTTAHSIIAFRTTDDDSKKLAPLFSTLDLNKGKPIKILRENIIKRLLAHPNEMVREWTYSFIGELEEASKQRSTQEIPKYDFGEGFVTYNPADVKRILKLFDRLFYETMRDTHVPQSLRAVVIGAMAPFLQYAAYLSYASTFSEEDTTAIENDNREEVIEIMIQLGRYDRFVKQLDAVLKALSERPLVEEKETSTSDIAKKLPHLENFTAIARVGSETYFIEPNPIPDAIVTGSALFERKRTIQIQTWDKYCRDSEEVEREIAKKAYQQTAETQEEQAAPQETLSDREEKQNNAPQTERRPRFEE